MTACLALCNTYRNKNKGLGENFMTKALFFIYGVEIIVCVLYEKGLNRRRKFYVSLERLLVKQFVFKYV